jgi:hypothetical protein
MRPEAGPAAVVEHIGAFRIERNRLVVVGNGVRIVILVLVLDAAVVVGVDKFRIKPDRLVVISECAVVIAHCAVHIAAVVEGRREF